ncbi:hypothetical protein Tco_0748999 [Tanacetum coccineum]|uniref:Reverse transcriptase domain-containing protein n=1 Tax=Tanacetum coccineum TaxID=301880 RepID=A0ABQ4Z067_9ASTR
MSPTMTTRSAGRPAVASRGGGTGGRAGSGGARTRGRSGDQGDGKIDGQGGQVSGQGSEVNDGVNGVPELSTIIAQQLQDLLHAIVAQVGDQGRGQVNGRNQNGDAVNDNIWGDVSKGCTYKEFLACNPNEYDGKGGAIVYTHWIEKMKSVQDMSGCKDSQKVKYTAGLFVGKALTWWNSQIHTRGREEVLNHVSKNNGSYIGYTPGCDEGRKKLNELTKLCTKLSKKVTSLEQDLKQTKQVYGKALTKLVNKVKHLEDQLKSTTKRIKAKVVISHEEEDLVSEDPSKQGRMLKTKYGDVEAKHAEEKSFEVHLDVLQRLSKATPEEEPTEDMEKALWVGLKRLFEPDKVDVLWKLQNISIVNCSYGFNARLKVASRRR